MNVSTKSDRARALGRPKPGSIPWGDRSAYPTTEGST
jgi:hypothetical protein